MDNKLNGYEVFDPRLIASAYLRNIRFYLDVLAFIPFSKIFWGFMNFD
jgi:hypothetical protein